jgi:hypothetical protein
MAIAVSFVGGGTLVAPSPAMAATTTRNGPFRYCVPIGTSGAFRCVAAISAAVADQLSLEGVIRKQGYKVTSSQVTSPSTGARRAVVKGTK